MRHGRSGLSFSLPRRGVANAREGNHREDGAAAAEGSYVQRGPQTAENTISYAYEMDTRTANASASIQRRCPYRGKSLIYSARMLVLPVRIERTTSALPRISTERAYGRD